jgi:hypothetical protein
MAKFTREELESLDPVECLDLITKEIPNWAKLSKRHFLKNKLKNIAIEAYLLLPEPSLESHAETTSQNILGSSTDSDY